MTFLSKVEHTWTITGRGCVIEPVALTNPDLVVHNGDAIQLRRPDGQVINTHIVGVELAKQLSGPCRVVFLLSKEVVKEDVPLETEIWVNEPK
jgi:hypothetical protein